MKTLVICIIWGGLSLSVVGCSSTASFEIRHAVKAVHLINSHPDSALTMLESIDDSLIERALFSQEEFVAICYYKAAGLIKRHQYEQAEKWLDKVLVEYTNDQESKHHYVLNKSLAQLQAVENWGRKEVEDSLRLDLVRQLMAVQNTQKRQFTLSEYELQLLNQPFYPVIVLFVFVALLIVFWYDRKEQRINSLFHSLESNELQNKQLRNQMCHIQNLSREQLGVGRRIYEKVRQGGSMRNISVADEQYFIDFYAFVEPESFTQLIAPYKKLSLRHTTYLILVNMGFNDYDIQQILFVQRSTIRNYRLRIKRSRIC